LNKNLFINKSISIVLKEEIKITLKALRNLWPFTLASLCIAKRPLTLNMLVGITDKEQNGEFMKLILLLALASCSAIMVQNPGNRPQYAPSDYRPKGIVKYLNQGWDMVKNKRREDAFKQAHEACAGEYFVTHEAPASSGYWITQQQNAFSAQSMEYMVIEFECKNKTASSD
jgi:hypothetical protein